MQGLASLDNYLSKWKLSWIDDPDHSLADTLMGLEYKIQRKLKVDSARPPQEVAASLRPVLSKTLTGTQLAVFERVVALMEPCVFRSPPNEYEHTNPYESFGGRGVTHPVLVRKEIRDFIKYNKIDYRDALSLTDKEMENLKLLERPAIQIAMSKNIMSLKEILNIQIVGAELEHLSASVVCVALQHDFLDAVTFKRFLAEPFDKREKFCKFMERVGMAIDLLNRSIVHCLRARIAKFQGEESLVVLPARLDYKQLLDSFQEKGCYSRLWAEMQSVTSRQLYQQFRYFYPGTPRPLLKDKVADFIGVALPFVRPIDVDLFKTALTIAPKAHEQYGRRMMRGSALLLTPGRFEVDDVELG